MGAPQTFKVAASPRERFFLARMLMSQKLKFKDRSKERSLYRARKALGLMAPSEEIVNGRPTGEIWRERKRSLFVVTEDNADFLCTLLGTLEKDAGDSFMLEDLLEQLEQKTDCEDADKLDTVDLDAEEPRWKFSASALIEDPTKLLLLLTETLEGEQSFGAWRAKMVAALKPATPEDSGSQAAPRPGAESETERLAAAS